jgi:hypothetical protein
MSTMVGTADAQTIPTGAPGATRPRIRVSAYCSSCGVQIRHGFTVCPPCAKSQRIRAAHLAAQAVFDQARACSRCGPALGTTAPPRYQLCSDCREVW